jgi:hypothetical protein
MKKGQKNPLKAATVTPTQQAPINVSASIEINGKTYDLLYNHQALTFFIQKTVDYQLGSELLTIGQISNVVYSGIMTHDYLNEQKSGITLMEVYTAVTELMATEEGYSELMKIYEAFSSCRAVVQFNQNVSKIAAA